MTTLLIGFDSAWTPHNAGALVAVVRDDDGSHRELGEPSIACFDDATRKIREWQHAYRPKKTIVMLDQPTVVTNATGQRPVERIVSSSVSLRYGGMQPANRARSGMFDDDAPVWTFLTSFGCREQGGGIERDAQILETYPVLALIALGWTLADTSKQSRPAGRLPKYNPARRATFSIDDWRHVCECAARELRTFGLPMIATWLDEAQRNAAPRKELQDKLDACLCLIVALHLADGRDMLFVGQWDTGYIVVPAGEALQHEIEQRCRVTGLPSSEWVRRFRHAADL